MDSTGRSGSISALLVAHSHSPYAWQADVDTTVVIPALTLLYLFALGRLGAPRWRIACYAGSMALLAVAFWTPLHHLALHYLLTAHLLQNVILAEWAPLLAVLGISRAMAEPLARRRVWRILTHPVFALPVWLVNYFAWHAPPVYDAALDHQAWLIHVEHAFYFGTGFLMWWPLVHDVPAAARVERPSCVRVRGIRARVAARASARATATAGLRLLRARAAALWGLTPLADQEIAGVTMASEQAIVLFVVFLYWFRRFLAEES